MVSLISDTDCDLQCLDFPLYLVRWNKFMSWKVLLWFILDLKPLHRFILLTTYILLLQVKLHITIMLIMKMSYEGTLLNF